MPAVISEEQCAELVVDQQEAEATVQKAIVPRDVRLSLFKSQCEDLVNYLQANECRPEARLHCIKFGNGTAKYRNGSFSTNTGMVCLHSLKVLKS